MLNVSDAPCLSASVILRRPSIEMALQPRDLIIDNWDRECIVAERSSKPTDKTLNLQMDSRMREMADAEWWSVIIVRGGAEVVPEPLVQFVRGATIEDAMRAVEYANEHGIRRLAELFPELVEIAQRHKQKK